MLSSLLEWLTEWRLITSIRLSIQYSLMKFCWGNHIILDDHPPHMSSQQLLIYSFRNIRLDDILTITVWDWERMGKSCISWYSLRYVAILTRTLGPPNFDGQATVNIRDLNEQLELSGNRSKKITLDLRARPKKKESASGTITFMLKFTLY